MNYWLFIVTRQPEDGGIITAKEILTRRLADRFWGLRKKSPKRLELQKGGQIVFYLGQPDMAFAASATLASDFFTLSDEQKQTYWHSKVYEAECGSLLENAQLWDTPRRVTDLTESLKFIENKKSWFAYFQGSIKQISEDDYHTIVQNKTPQSEDCTLIADIKNIESNTTTDPTMVQALVNARVGHGKFGLQVRQLWNHRCSVTGSSTQAALEASHIRPWADSNDSQRLDPNNGLLLTANLHKLFDAGLISFEESGKMLVSSKLSSSEQAIFDIVGKRLSRKPSAETANYLSYHRARFVE